MGSYTSPNGAGFPCMKRVMGQARFVYIKKEKKKMFESQVTAFNYFYRRRKRLAGLTVVAFNYFFFNDRVVLMRVWYLTSTVVNQLG